MKACPVASPARHFNSFASHLTPPRLVPTLQTTVSDSQKPCTTPNMRFWAKTPTPEFEAPIQTTTSLLPATSTATATCSDGDKSATVEKPKKKRQRQRRQNKGPPLLRDYQKDCIEAILRDFRAGHTRLGISSPTGSGKTTTFVNLIPRVVDDGDRNKTMIIVSSIQLADQAKATVIAVHGTRYRIGVEQGAVESDEHDGM